MCLMPTNEQEEKGFSSCKKEDGSVSSPLLQPTRKTDNHPCCSALEQAEIAERRMRKGRKRGEEVEPERRKTPGPQLFPFLAVTQRKSSSLSAPQCGSQLQAGTHPSTAQPSPGAVGILRASSGHPGDPEQSSFSSKPPPQPLRRDVISVFRARQKHRAQLQPWLPGAGSHPCLSTELGTCTDPSRARAHVLLPWAQL